MALKGNFIEYGYRDSDTETVELIAADGGVEVLPKAEQYILNQWSEAYVRVVSYHVWRRSENDLRLDINYFVYENEEAAKSGEWEDGLAYNTVVPIVKIDWETSMGNTWEFAYKVLLEQVSYFEGFESV